MNIKGTKTADVLVGTDQDDVIRGGRGKDWIESGNGLDVLFGGKGRDTFVIASGDFDVIGDFQPGKDRIIIDGNLYGGGPGGGAKPIDMINYEDPLLSYDGKPLVAVSLLTADDVLLG